jgi:hypothetical protein
MAIFALDRGSEDDFAAKPEIRMNIQVGVTKHDHGQRRSRDDPALTYYLVLGSRLAIRFDEAIQEKLGEIIAILVPPRDQFEQTWRKQFDESWRNWADREGNSISLEPVWDDEALYALFTIFTGFPPPTPFPPRSAPPAPPPSAPSIYGHLPFQKITWPDDVFYRYESFPTSRRIDQTHLTIAPGTYAAPASELFFMPTGLSAVARQALPSLMPARWRWELQPVARTNIRFGTSVPLYGQSGGGVEVRFEGDPPPATPAKNRGPIANPVMLPVL